MVFDYRKTQLGQQELLLDQPLRPAKLAKLRLNNPLYKRWSNHRLEAGGSWPIKNLWYNKKISYTLGDLGLEASATKLFISLANASDFSPIENMWSKIKNSLRKLAPRTLKEFKKAIHIAFGEINKNDLVNWYKHCRYICWPSGILL